MDMNRDELLKQIMALDFTIVDLNLYLNTHPYDQNALMRYNAAVMQSRMLKNQYESLYGPLTAYHSTSCYPWQWINNPWPWSYEFNFELAGEEC
ncbi:MAG: spore coat protein CotJB [Clostridiaceae bacterium]|nr:spore coat protein CotJB [Clostridiaceae bacterium]